MKIMMESSGDIITIDGRATRLWRGVTERGTRCYIFVARVVPDDYDGRAEFERDLAEQLPPGPPSQRRILR